MSRWPRTLVACAGLMGAAGVALAALAAHQADPSRLLPASSMLLFHASAVLATVALAGRGAVHARIGLISATGFVVASLLFASDLAMRHFTGERLFPYAAPIGGNLLIVSWVSLTVCALWPRRR
jgi:uncharacterized membrane protein YgdD (TMEM256/DUF423 family)